MSKEVNQMVPTKFEGEITLKRDVICNCPYEDMVDVYEVTINYCPRGRVLELQQLSDFLDSFSDKELTQEDVTEDIHGFVESLGAYVRVEGDHFGITVVTERGKK